MGGCLSVDSGEVQQLKAQVHHLQQQLGHTGNGAVATGHEEVLFFPDGKMPCRHGRTCRRGPSCQYAHHPTSLSRFLQILSSATRSLDICVFTITCNEIAEAVIAAHRKGVRVRVITDDDQMTKTGSDIQEFVQAGIPVRHDRAVSHMHHKYCIIDARTLMNGSFNWTRQAVLQNNENVVISHNMAVVAKFGEQFEKLWAQFAGNRA